MDQGRLVPDPLVLAMVGEKLNEPEFADGCMFDGFPRTLQQARSLDESLAKRGTPLDLALELRADEDELVTRMLRARPRKSGARMTIPRRSPTGWRSIGSRPRRCSIITVSAASWP